MVPLVSCLLVTQPGRESLAAQAIADFAAQSWPARELIAVCEANTLAEMDIWSSLFGRCHRRWPALDITPFVVTRNVTLGACRNDSVVKAGGEFVIQWDDDDRYHPDRIMHQVQPLLGDNPPYGASCLTSQLYWFAQERTLYWVDWYNRRPRYESVLIPGTVCVRTPMARACPYPEEGPESRRGEDGVFLRQVAAQEPVYPVDDSGWLYLRQFHGANTWGRDRFLGNARWLGRTVAQLEGRRDFLEPLFNDLHWVTPGPVRVMGRDGPAFTFDVQDEKADG